jgi:hypothetical protein
MMDLEIRNALFCPISLPDLEDGAAFDALLKQDAVN